MATRPITVSDITDIEIAPDQVVKVTIREHPSLEDPRKFDTTEEELKALKTISNLVKLEYKFPDGTTQEVFATSAEFNKLLPVEKVTALGSNRGRAKGFSPNAG
jgi:hypothetical protein